MKQLTFILMFFISVLSFGQIQNKAIGFIENKGQIVDQKGKPNDAVKYLLNTNGLNVQLRQNGFSYDVYETKKHPLSKKDKARLYSSSLEKGDTLKNPNYKLEYIYHRVDIDFENCNCNAELISEEKSKDYDNYYNVPSQPNGVLNVHKFQKITYKNIYPKIDVVFSIPEDKSKPVEYNFIVRPNGKITDIQLKFNGVKTELVDNKIKMNLRFGEIQETVPMSWIETGNNKKEITINYKQLRKNVFGFESSDNLENKTLVIDPTPIRLWGTYYGDGYQEFKSNTIKTDNENNIIFTGLTYSSSNVGTIGAFQSTGIPNWETAFIAKFDPNGVRIWGTYVKNNIDSARIYDVVVNSLNEIYVVGYAWDQDGLSNTITTPGCFREFGSPFSREGILIKFNQNGQRIWGTFYGGDQGDEIKTICLDSQENLIIGGKTNSATGISTSDGYILNKPNSTFYPSGFFAKFNPNGMRLYGSYFEREFNYSAIDLLDNVIFGGQYFVNSDYPNISTTNSHQTICNITDIFLVKFDLNFNRKWCTYYGGTENTSAFGNSDRITGLGTDNQNNIYFTGTTSSTDNIATVGSYKQFQPAAQIDAFLVKFNTNGTRLWGTYYGANSNFDDTGESASVSPEGNVFIAGNTQNSTNIATANSFQTVNRGSDECFFAKFSSNGNLIWSSFYGTPSQDFTLNLFYKNNIIYFLGYSTAIATLGNDLGTPGTYMPNGGGFFLGKFQDCISSPQLSFNGSKCIGSNLNLNASGGTNYSWTGPNGFLSSEQNPTITNVTTLNSGQYICTITGTGGCDGPATLNVIVGDTEKPIPNTNPLPTINGDCNTTIAKPTATDNCAGVITATTTNPISYNLPGNYTINWSYNDGNGNIETQTQQITITDVALPTLSTPQNFCVQQNPTVNALAIIGQNIKWYDAQINGNVISNTTVLVNGVTYFASQTINGCESIRVAVLVNIQNTNAPTGTSPQIFCSTQNATLADVVVAGNTIKWYGSATSANYLPLSTILVNGTTYYVSQTINGCESTNRLPVAITLITNLNANNYFKMICDNLNDGFEILDLSNYNTSLLSNTSNCTFDYFNSSLGAENQIQSELINTFSNFNLGLGNKKIYVRITSNNGCFQIVTLELDLVAKPIINIDDIVPICQGSNVSIDAGVGFDSYLWSNGIMGQHTLNFNQAGSYSVTVTQNHSRITCSSTKNFSVVNSNLATISEIITTDWDYNSILVQLAPISLGNYQYSLDGFTYQNSNYFGNLNAGAYTVYVKDFCGITKQDVYLLTYPKFFTPNGDSFNDYWKIKFSIFEPNLQVKIFDRFGKFIAGFASNSEGWDGNYNSEPMPSNDYWFVVTRQNGKEFRGHFALKR